VESVFGDWRSENPKFFSVGGTKIGLLCSSSLQVLKLLCYT